MSSSKRLLIVDDDLDLCEMLGVYLAADGFLVEAVHNGRRAEECVATGRFNLMVLDIMLPGMSGKEVLKSLRPKSDIPVIMLTARGDPSDRIVGLELGADDYLTKPFEPAELVARINAVLRRIEPARPSVITEFLLGDLRLSLGNRLASISGAAQMLTSVEFNMLVILARKPGEVVSREELGEALGRPLLPFERSIDMHVLNLRKKLGSTNRGNQRILTIRGAGYMLAVEEDLS